MPALASFAVLLLFCIDGAIGDLGKLNQVCCAFIISFETAVHLLTSTAGFL